MGEEGRAATAGSEGQPPQSCLGQNAYACCPRRGEGMGAPGAGVKVLGLWLTLFLFCFLFLCL